MLKLGDFHGALHILLFSLACHLLREKPASLRAFVLPTVSSSAEAERYARATITISSAAVVWPPVTTAMILRSVAVASILRTVMTTAIVTIVPATRVAVVPTSGVAIVPIFPIVACFAGMRRIVSAYSPGGVGSLLADSGYAASWVSTTVDVASERSGRRAKSQPDDKGSHCKWVFHQ